MAASVDDLVAEARRLRRAGAVAQALSTLERVINAQPDLTSARIERARALLAGGRAPEALDDARRAGADAHAPPAAKTVLALAYRACGRHAEAVEAARAALAQSETDAEARETLAFSLAHLDRWREAEAEYARLRALSPRAALEGEISRGRALADAGRLDEADAAFASVLERAPLHMEALRSLGHLRWMRGRTDDFAAPALAAAARHPDQVAPLLLAADLLRRADRIGEAAALLERAHPAAGRDPTVRSALSVLLCDLDRPTEAVLLSEEALAQAPEHRMFRMNAATARLCAGQGEAALAHARWGRALAPLDQEWIALEATALRVMGDPGYRRLYDYDRFVRPFTLATPPGFADLAAFNAELAVRLRAMHVHVSHPLDQSLRGGTQTPVSLLESRDPIIAALFSALNQAVAAYVTDIGPGADHPFTARNTGRHRYSGCWSVRLRAGGGHVNHVHPEGWISSAYYVAVPDDVTNDLKRGGWLAFGAPRFKTKLQAEHWEKPETGRLVLFPSYMWHGVSPFVRGEERLTVAFDVTPD